MNTVNELVEHLNKYKDAVVIIGPGVLAESDKNEYSMEEFNENYNRRTLTRDTEKMWNFFNEKMKKDFGHETRSTYREISNLDDVVSMYIDQNTNAPIFHKKKDLHGLLSLFRCNKCKAIYTDAYVYECGEENHECELCEGTLRPTVLLSGERYDNQMFLEIQEAVKASHTVILIGMDYTEEALMQLIAEYGDVKTFINAEDNNEEKVLVSIQSKEEEFDPNEMVFFEFVVKDDIKSALERLNGVF